MVFKVVYVVWGCLYQILPDREFWGLCIMCVVHILYDSKCIFFVLETFCWSPVQDKVIIIQVSSSQSQ